ncbi:NAD(P)H-dependent oxidoreductase [Prochlorococcus marinus]|uniref:Possible reductase n=1 Tax=Prochlorococcus marinus (strain MIT 9211) TaxID=93059 RepID=A9B9E0_PROM4|nr:NAD(P)H-dependent oxidoreductase [Prochlorococcus marinus]ABX07977.1 possible reductase [Prochlorococcus marinus str. MIT 9211]
MITTNDLLVMTASNGENLKLAERFVLASKKLGAKADLLDLTTLNLPLYNPRTHQEKGSPSSINALHEQLVTQPRWVICAPEYNGSIPPVLTSAIAWLSVQENDFRKLFNGRPIAIASASGGGCMELLLSMRIQLTHLGAQVVGRQLASNSKNPAKDESIEDLLKRLMQMEPLRL